MYSNRAAIEYYVVNANRVALLVVLVWACISFCSLCNMAAETAPDGSIAIFFTGATQEIFGCVIDRDVTPEAPQKIILLEKIMDDFRNRAGVSDFSAVKKEMQVCG